MSPSLDPKKHKKTLKIIALPYPPTMTLEASTQGRMVGKARRKYAVWEEESENENSPTTAATTRSGKTLPLRLST